MIKKVIFIFIVCQMQVSSGFSKEAEPDQKMLEFNLSGFSKDGKKTWQVNGESADIFSDVVNLDNVVANVYGQTESMTLTADKGSLYKKTGFVHLEDNVVAVSSSGGRLTANSLDWDQANQLVTSDSVVNIKRDNLTSVAKGAKAQPDLKKIYLNEEVEVKIEPDKDAFSMEDAVGGEKNPIVITCDGPLEIEYDKNIATFNNNVHTVESATSEIFCDRMVVEFDYKNKKIDRVRTFGNTRILKDGNISYSDDAVYTNSDKKLVLIGNPKLIIYSEGDFDAAFGD